MIYEKLWATLQLRLSCPKCVTGVLKNAPPLPLDAHAWGDVITGLITAVTSDVTQNPNERAQRFLATTGVVPAIADFLSAFDGIYKAYLLAVLGSRQYELRRGLGLDGQVVVDMKAEDAWTLLMSPSLLQLRIAVKRLLLALLEREGDASAPSLRLVQELLLQRKGFVPAFGRLEDNFRMIIPTHQN